MSLSHRARALLAGLALGVAGCQQADLAQAPVFTRAESGDFSLRVPATGWVTPLEQHVVGCPQNFWGVKVAAAAPEGTRIEKGEVVLSLDMDQYENRLKRRRRQHQNQRLHLDRLEAQQAQARAAGETQVTEKRLSLATAREKLGILLDGPLEQEVGIQRLMVEAGVAAEGDRSRKLEQEQRLRERGFTSELAYLDAVGELEKARRRRQAARADLQRVVGGPRPVDRTRLTAEEAMIALETAQVEGEHEGRLTVQGLALKQKNLEVEASVAAVAREERRMARGTIRAPISGLVLHSLYGQLGFRVEPGSVLWSMQEVLRIVRVDSYKLAARVGERDVDHVREGARAVVTFPALPGVEVGAEVSKIGKFAVPAVAGDQDGAKVFEVELLLDSTEAPLKPNLTARVEIERTSLGEGAWARVVPEALHDPGEPGGATYLETEQGRRIPVEVAARDEHYVYFRGPAPTARLRLAAAGGEGAS